MRAGALYTTRMSQPHRILAWADADQIPLLRDVASHASLAIVAVGSDEADAGVKLANAFEADRVEDIRRAVLREDIDLLLLASPMELDASTIKLIRERNVRIVTSQPHPAALSQPAGDIHTRFSPLMRRSPGYRETAEILSDFGEARCINITMRSGVGQGNLFARLFDAVEVIDALCGEPEIIDAALVSPTPGVAETLVDLHGHMTINMRFPENRCACVAVSDRAGAWFRGVTILGDGGCLRINDDGFDWTATDGTHVDAHQHMESSSPGTLIAAQCVRMLNQQDTIDAPEPAKLLAVCEAARLSCRTGEGETPRKIMQMLSHV